jgi:branched-chain amino acid transport system ATP-binding protein
VSLVTEDLSVRFGGHTAVDHVSASFLPGTLTAIVGPNGAGKTTFFNLVSGQIRATSGRVALDDVDLSHASPSERTRQGLGRAFQLTNLFPNLTVFENVRLAVQAEAGIGLSMWRLWSRDRILIERSEEILHQVSLASKSGERAAVLTHGEQRKLEVALLMALRPRVFMFDEPTAGMSVDEVPVILDLIKRLKQDRSNIVLLVEHKLDVVRELADRIIVLHQGRLVADGEPSHVIASSVVQLAYLGIAAAPQSAS